MVLFQGVTDDVRTAASDVLVALASSHFHFVMSELQGHLKAPGGTSEELVFVTLGKLASSYSMAPWPPALVYDLLLVCDNWERGSFPSPNALC